MKNRKLLLSLLIFTFVGMLTSSTRAVSSITINADGNTGSEKSWTSIGPNNVSGRVRSAMFDKYNKGVVYAGTVGGGLYVSVNNGKNWKEVKLGNGEGIAVTALAQDENGIVYVGTGEGYYANALHNENPTGHSNNTSGMIGTGIYKMTVPSDYNKAWATGLTDQAKYTYILNNIVFNVLPTTKPTNRYDISDKWAYINEMACVGTTVYVGTKNAGLQVSTDGGTTFTNVPLEGNASINIYDLKVNANNRLAVSYDNQGGRVAINTVENPTTFTKIFDNTSIGYSADTTVIGRIKLSFGQKNPNTLCIVATDYLSDYNYNYFGAYGSLRGIYLTRQLDNASWSSITSSNVGLGSTLGNAMAVCVNDRDIVEKVYVGGTTIKQGYDNNGVGIFSFSSMASNTVEHTSAFYVAPNIHNILMLDNPQTLADSIFLMVTTDAGIFTYQFDSLLHGARWIPSNFGMNSLQAYKVAGGADGSIVAASQSNAITYMIGTKDNDTLSRAETIWSINNPDYLTLVSNEGDAYMGYNSSMWSGSNVAASAINKTLPQQRKPFILARPNNNITRTYGNKGDYETINTNTWTYGGGVSQLLFNGNAYSDLALAPFNTPMAFWETFNASTKVKDSVYLKLTEHSVIHRNGKLLPCINGERILDGDSVMVQSDNLGYPFFHVFNKTAESVGDTVIFKNQDTSILVQSPVQARLLIGTNAGAFLTTKILDFSRTFQLYPTKTDLAWGRIFTVPGTDSINKLNSRIHTLALSMDGNYAFIAIDKYSNYSTYEKTQLLRIKGLNESDLADAIEFKGASADINRFVLDTIATFTRQISSIRCNPIDSTKMVITFDGYNPSNANVMYSNDVLSATPTFNDISLSADKTKPVFTALYETMKNATGNVLYVGSDDGIYKTTNYMAANVDWTLEDSTLNVPVYDLWQQIQNQPMIHYYTYSGSNSEEVQFNATQNPGIMYAATYGKGILMNKKNIVEGKPDVSISNVTNDKVQISLNVYPNPASTQTTIAYTLDNNTKVSFNLYDINGRLVSTLNKGQQAKGSHNQVLNINNMKKGVYMIKMITNNSVRSAKLIVE